MGKSSPKVSPAKTLTPSERVAALLEQAQAHFDSPRYAQSVTLGLEKSDGAVSRFAFDAGVFKSDGLMCIVVEAAEVLSDYSVIGTSISKRSDVPTTSLFVGDPEALSRAVMAKAVAKDIAKADKTAAAARVKAWCLANVGDPRAMSVFGNVKAFVKTCVSDADRTTYVNAVISTLGAEGAKPTTATWRRVDAILADIGKQ